MPFRLTALFVLAIFAISPPVHAQTGEPESPGSSSVETSPGMRVEIFAVRAFGGAVLGQGTFRSVCDCAYASGAGGGFGAAAGVLVRRTEEWSFVGEIVFSTSFPHYTSTVAGDAYVMTGEHVNADIERRADLVMMWAGIGAAGRWQPWHEPLHFSAGLRAAVPVHATLKDVETIRTPGLVYFDTGTNRRTRYDGTLDDASPMEKFFVGITAEIGYDLPLGPALRLTPAAGYLFPISTIVAGSPDWKLGLLYGSVGLGIPI